MSTTTAIIDPAEFVRSYTEAKYWKEIRSWNEAEAPEDLIDVLRVLKAPKIAFVEVVVALAEEVFPTFKKKHPKDLRPRQAIDAAKAWFKDQTETNTNAVRVAAIAANRAAHDCAARADCAAQAATDSAYVAGNAASITAYIDDVEYPVAYSTVVSYACIATSNAIRAGLSVECAMDIIRKAGHKRFAFLRLD
jgi:hypothetical protein